MEMRWNTDEQMLISSSFLISQWIEWMKQMKEEEMDYDGQI